MEKLKGEDTSPMKFKAELLWQRVQPLKEGILQDDIDNLLHIVND